MIQEYLDIYYQGVIDLNSGILETDNAKKRSHKNKILGGSGKKLEIFGAVGALPSVTVPILESYGFTTERATDFIIECNNVRTQALGLVD